MHPFGNSVLILSKDNNERLVTVCRPEDQTKLCLPGGKQEPYENSLSGAIREVYEETGIVLDSNQLIPFYSNFCISQEIEYWVTTYLVFIKENKEFKPIENNTNPKWLSVNDFLQNSYYEEYYQNVFDKLSSIRSKITNKLQ